MAKHLIEDIKVGVSGGGMACGPVPGCVVTEIQLRDTGDDSVMYYGMTEVDGTDVHLKSEESLYETQVSDNFDDTEAWDKAYASEIRDYDDNDPIWKLLYFFVKANWDEVERMKSACIGKNLEDIVIPECDEEI